MMLQHEFHDLEMAGDHRPMQRRLTIAAMPGQIRTFLEEKFNDASVSVRSGVLKCIPKLIRSRIVDMLFDDIEPSQARTLFQTERGAAIRKKRSGGLLSIRKTRA